MSDKKKSKAKNIIKNVGGIISGTAESIKHRIEDSDIAKKADSGKEAVKNVLDDTGISSTYDKVKDGTSHQFDTISGKKILDIVEEQVALQSQYNDILATKLDEALKRIAKLEKTMEDTVK